MTEMERSDDGTWLVRPTTGEGERTPNPAYLDKIATHLTALDPVFESARKRCEFEFVCSLLRVRGLEDPGWDPYETTLHSIPLILQASDQVESPVAQKHLQLWIYLHILEASEPYELLANLIAVAAGDRFHLDRFPVSAGSRPISPGTKIRRLRKAAEGAALGPSIDPLVACWDPVLRNAIGHADYSFYGNELRTMRPVRSYSRDDVWQRVAGAVAYHESLSTLYGMHIESYTEPVLLDLHPGWGPSAASERAMTIIREGGGLVGVKAALTREEVARGRIQWRMVRATRGEIAMLEGDPEMVVLPGLPQAASVARRTDTQP